MSKVDNNPRVEVAPTRGPRSWNPKNYLYLKEGRKAKLSLKIINGILAAIVLYVLLSDSRIVLNDESNEKADKIYLAYPVTMQDSPKDIPFYDEIQERRKLQKDAQSKSNRKKQEIVFSRIKPISLSQNQTIPSGSEADAILISGGANGTIKAKLTSPVVVDGDTIVVVNSILVGKGQSTEDRLYIVFSKLIKSDGSEEKIMAEAFDAKDRIIGLQGEKIGSYAFKIAASSGLIFLSGYTGGLQNQQQYGFEQRRTRKDAIFEGVSGVTLEHGKRFLDSMDKNSVEVKSNTKLIVIFNEDKQ